MEKIIALKNIKYKSNIIKEIKKIITIANLDNVSLLFNELKEFQKLALKIVSHEQENYEKYFDKQMTHEMNLIKIEYRKIEMRYREVVFKTDQRAKKFIELQKDKGLSKDMRDFYIKEHLNILKPKYLIEQVLENFQKYIEVLNLIKEEYNEWFFLGNLDFLKQILQPYILLQGETSKKGEIWIYKKYQNELTLERKKKMHHEAGMQFKQKSQ